MWEKKDIRRKKAKRKKRTESKEAWIKEKEKYVDSTKSKDGVVSK